VCFVILLITIDGYSRIKEVPEIDIGIPKIFYKFYPDPDLDRLEYVTYLNWKFLLYDYLIFWIIVFAYFQLKKIYYNYFSAKIIQKKQIY
jgi:hypothetical protein